MVTGCRDMEDEGILSTSADGQELPEGAIRLSPFDQTLDVQALLDGEQVSDGLNAGAVIAGLEVTSPEADFLMPLDSGRIYVEQNDDRQWRTADIDVRLADGSRRLLTLAQPPATRASAAQSRRNFYRHHGVGYSYEAVGGEYCNMNYVRCQLLNRAIIDQLEKEVLDPIITLEYINETRVEHSVSTSFVDYVQNSNFSAEASMNLIVVFSGDITAACSSFEEGNIETYIMHDARVFPTARYTLEPGNIASYVDRYPNVLTSSFRKAVKALARTSASDWQAVDKFLEVWGTHMVYEVELGASLSLDVQVETHKFQLNEKLEAMAAAQLATLFDAHFSLDQSKRNYEVLRDCKCRLDVVGGDMTILDEIIGMTTFSNEDIDISMQDLDDWTNSIYFDDDDLEHSNVEMTAMHVVPIWELISDEQVAARVESRVEANAVTMQKLLGNRNFINVKIPYSQTKYVCRIGNQKYSINNPDVTDVIAAGRHVATICLETVPAISEKEKVRVVYPIYEGRVKQSSGLCVYNNNVYKVSWLNGQLTVMKAEADVLKHFDGNIYMTGGALSVEHSDVVTYLEGHPIMGCERPGGIGVDGSLAGKPVRVVKHFNHFYLKDKERYDNLPNWSWSTQQPHEAADFPDYFDATTWKDRMVRNDDYIYVWNTTEIGYE